MGQPSYSPEDTAMKKISMYILLFILFIVLVVPIVYAASVSKVEPSWFEHVDLMQVLIGGLFIIVSWFLVRTLKKIDANQDKLFTKYENHETRLSNLEGQHNARTGMKLNCGVE